MDKFTLARKYFIGKNKPGVWASVYSYRPQGESVFERRGEIFAVITLRGPEDFDTSTAGNLLLDHFHENYFENEKDSVLISLEKAVMGMERRLMTLIENEVSVHEEGVEVHLNTMVVYAGFVYFVSMGQARAYVFRGGNLLDITSYLKDPTGEGIIKVGSSRIEAGDVYMLATPEAVEEYSEDDFVESVSNFSEQNLKGRMIENDSMIALVMVKVEDKETEKGATLMKAQGGESFVAKSEQANTTARELESEQVNEETKEFGDTEKRERLDFEPRDEKEEETLPYDYSKSSRFSEQKTVAEKIKEKGKQIIDKGVAYFNRIKDQIAGNKRTVSVSGVSPVDAPGFETKVSRSDQFGQEVVDKELPTYLYILQKAGRKIWEVILVVKKTVLGWLGADQDKIFLRGAGVKKNWKVIAILIVVIGFILYFGIKAQVDDAKTRKLTEEARVLVDNAKEVAETVSQNVPVVLNSPTNSERKEELLADLEKASTKLSEARKLGVLVEDIENAEDLVEMLKNKLNRVLVMSPSLLVDFAAHFEDADTYDFDLLDGFLYVSDSGRSVIYKVSTGGDDPVEFIPSGSNLSGPRAIAFDQKKELIVHDNSEDKALATINIETKAVTKHLGLSRGKLGNVVQLEAYRVGSEDRIYAVRTDTKDLVYMRSEGSSGYSLPILRAREDAFANASDIAVDGRVYILSKGSGLSRYLGENKDPVSIQGLPSGDSVNESVAMDVDATKIFFADPVNRRVLVFTKSRGENAGIFDLIAQVKPEGEIFKNIKEVVVDTSNNNLYVLDGTKIWKIDLSLIRDFEL
ncbi:hypothetical protein JW796_04640 [Candidatus Dojkabacteria bacterium]|nr:hypothetical protein [Candidatus Dojkabacteria bacterium]